jgi:hypothetical protein
VFSIKRVKVALGRVDRHKDFAYEPVFRFLAKYNFYFARDCYVHMA